MIQEYDVVQSLRRLNDKVQEKSIGTVLIVYDSIPPQYEVEFVNKTGETLDIVTVSGADIQKLDTYETLY